MAKMWTSNEEFDFETARDHASKLVLLGSAHRAGIFEALLEALCTLGFVHKRQDMYSITEKARADFIKEGNVGVSLPHFLDIAIEDMVRGRSPMAETT